MGHGFTEPLCGVQLESMFGVVVVVVTNSVSHRALKGLNTALVYTLTLYTQICMKSFS